VSHGCMLRHGDVAFTLSLQVRLLPATSILLSGRPVSPPIMGSWTESVPGGAVVVDEDAEAFCEAKRPSTSTTEQSVLRLTRVYEIWERANTQPGLDILHVTALLSAPPLRLYVLASVL
jgi:hypothetical protein